MNRPGPGGRESAIPFQSLQNELLRLIDNYLKPAPRGDAPTPPAETWGPPWDAYETPEETLVLIELPGVDPGRVELSIADNVLTARGSKSPDEALEPFLRVRERRFGAFVVEAPLSGPVDLDAARAEARDGVLTIHLPKRRAEQPRVIPIRTS